jgi:DNA-binding NtrC family response regulator
MPALRERKEDIPLLVNHFLKKYKNEMPKIITTVSSPVMEALMRYNWQGNVRQLENIIYRTMVATHTETIEIESLPIEIQQYRVGSSATQDQSINQPISGESPNIFVTPESQTQKTKPPTMQEMEKHALVEALKVSGGNVEKTAKLLGLSRATCYRKIKKYQIE